MPQALLYTFFAATLLTYTIVIADNSTMQSGVVIGVGRDPVHGPIQSVTSIRQCPSYCYSYHRGKKSTMESKAFTSLIHDCIRVCQGVKQDHPGLLDQHLNIPTRR